MWKVVALLLFVSGLSFSQAINCFDSTPKCVVKDVSEGATSCSDYVQNCQNVNGVYWCPIDLQDKLCTDFDKVGGQNVNGFIVSSNFVSKNEMTYSGYQNILSSLGVSCMPAQTAQSLSLDNVWVCEGYLQGGQVKPAPQGGIPSQSPQCPSGYSYNISTRRCEKPLDWAYEGSSQDASYQSNSQCKLIKEEPTYPCPYSVRNVAGRDFCYVLEYTGYGGWYESWVPRIFIGASIPAGARLIYVFSYLFNVHGTYGDAYGRAYVYRDEQIIAATGISIINRESFLWTSDGRPVDLEMRLDPVDCSYTIFCSEYFEMSIYYNMLTKRYYACNCSNVDANNRVCYVPATCPSGAILNPQGYCELKPKGAVVSSDENRCNHLCMTQDTVSSFIQSEPAQDTPQQVSSSDTSLQECTNPVFFAGFRKDCRAGGLTVLGASCCGISGWFSGMCSNSEKELKKRREAGTCKEIGTYCSKKVFGVCIEKKRSFCCFNSQLARILQESCFRPQLGRGWGSPKNPNCGGIALSDFQRVDLGNPDCVRAIEDWISQRAQSFQERLNNMNPTQKSLEAIQTWFQKVSK